MADLKAEIEVLTKEKFQKEPDFYQKGFDEIHESLLNSNIPELLRAILIIQDSPINLAFFLNKYPVNSVVYITVDNKIVGYIYGAPLTDKLWVIDWIKIHDDFRGNGYGPQLISYCLRDILKKGCEIVKLKPLDNNIKCILKKIAEESSFILEMEFDEEGWAYLNLGKKEDYVLEKHLFI